MKHKLYIIFSFITLGIVNIILSSIPPQTLVKQDQVTPISADQAVIMAINNVSPTDNGFVLNHPRHQVAFAPDGITFVPKVGGPTWRWHLTEILTETELDFDIDGVSPTQPDATTISYDRGDIIELYRARTNTVEQQFVIPQPLTLGETDLVISGAIDSAGAFSRNEQGWQWQTTEGQVALGDVTVFDATGQTLPARLDVTADSTQLTVDGMALAQASYPVTIDPEIGTNDFRISDMGSGLPNMPLANEPDVAYNSNAQEYLVVWQGQDNQGGLSYQENEIYGQRIDATTGAEVGENDFRISDMGPDGDPTFNALSPTVIYNPNSNEYLVVWIGDDNIGSADEAFEAYGQRLDATGQEIGSNDFRISDMGAAAINPNYDVLPYGNVAVAHNSTANQYLVVWSGDESALPLVDDEFEVFGQLLQANGSQTGTNDFRISDMGVNGTTTEFSDKVDVVYNSTDNEYLVVWEGTQIIPLPSPLIPVNQTEIYGQRINATTGAEVGGNDFLISDMGGLSSSDYAGQDPVIAYNSDDNEYLVVWRGDDNVGTLVDNEFEIFGQRLDATGAGIGDNDFRISDTGPDGNIGYFTDRPDVSYNSSIKEYLVVWYGFEQGNNSPTNDQHEIYGQRFVGATGKPIGDNDFRISDMGPEDNSILSKARFPAIAYNSTVSGYLVVWQGNESDEVEIHGQLLSNNSTEIAPNDFRISDMWTDTAFDAFLPAVAYNSQTNEYLVVWQGREGVWLNDTPFLYETEIYGQRINAATGDEVGVNDFRISDMGVDGNPLINAFDADVTYNSMDNEYLVVWAADDDTNILNDEEFEIFGQRLGADGAEIGANDFRISDMGPDGSPAYIAIDPAVAYNSTNNEYLVVWEGDDNIFPLVDEEFEVFGQRLGADGAEIGANDFRISDAGPNSNVTYDATTPAVTYNSTDNEYLVVWNADDDTASLTDNEQEIYGQRLSSAGLEIGSNDVRISDMGPDGDQNYDAIKPSVVHNNLNNEYLIVWMGDDDIAPLIDDYFQMFGQRLNASGVEVGSNDFLISDIDPNISLNFHSPKSSVVFNDNNNEYLVIWVGYVGLPGEAEVYGKRLHSTTGQAIETQMQLSDMGPDGDTAYNAFRPALATNSTNESSLVVWQGDDAGKGLDENEFEIFGQMVAFTGTITISAPTKIYLPLVIK